MNKKKKRKEKFANWLLDIAKYITMTHQKRRKGKNMNVAIGMMIFIFLIANAGGLYFYLQNR